jgi:hypothetical protein
MDVKGLFGWCCGQDRDGPRRVSGKLLLGHAPAEVVSGAADKSLEGQQLRQPNIGSGRPRVLERQSASGRRCG